LDNNSWTEVKDCFVSETFAIQNSQNANLICEGNVIETDRSAIDNDGAMSCMNNTFYGDGSMGTTGIASGNESMLSMAIS
jgi:hypothetical protein